MPGFIALLSSIPDTVWSGIIGAIVALSGVLLSSRSSASHLRLQLQHDSSEKAKERTSELRREVYLQAIQELVKANLHLANLPNLDPTKINISDGFQGFFASAARLQLVAEPKTVLLVNKLVGEYGELILKLLTQLQPVHAAQADIQIADNHYTLAQSEVTRILGGMAKLNESGNPDTSTFRVLQSSFEFQQERSTNYANDRDVAWGRFHRANIAFQRVLFTKLRDLVSRQVHVMIELRRDLGQSGDLGAIEKQMRQQMQRMEERFNLLISNLGDATLNPESN